MIFFSAFAVHALGGRPIVVMNAVSQGDAKITVRPKEDTGRVPKGKKLIVKQKTAVGIG